MVAAIYRIAPVFGFLPPVRTLYIGGIGWNPVAGAGVIVNLKRLKRAVHLTQVIALVGLVGRSP